jgi:hypothetical protein
MNFLSAKNSGCQTGGAAKRARSASACSLGYSIAGRWLSIRITGTVRGSIVGKLMVMAEKQGEKKTATVD